MKISRLNHAIILQCDDMAMTLTEKILAVKSGQREVQPGEIVFCRVDLAMGTDVTVPLSVEVFEKMGAESVFDADKLALVNDHFVPAKDVKAAELSRIMRRFAQKHQIKNYFEVGRSGICHTIVPDSGLVLPGDLVVGADSHTCTYGALGAFATGVGSTDLAAVWALGEIWLRVPQTIRADFRGTLPPHVGAKDMILHLIGELGVEGARYRALEFGGEALSSLDMAGRFTIANMAVEAGAKCGIMAADAVVQEYLKPRTDRKFEPLALDENAVYFSKLDVDVSRLEPLVAQPYLPANIKPANQFNGMHVDQVVIGSCTNGRLEDFRSIVPYLKDRKVHPHVRLIVLPGSQEVILGMIREGIAEIILQAGGIISPPTCGPCIGGHMGILAGGEIGLYTTNRNFRGRSGHPDSKVYLCGPQVAAVSAVTGEITDPRNFS